MVEKRNFVAETGCTSGCDNHLRGSVRFLDDSFHSTLEPFIFSYRENCHRIYCEIIPVYHRMNKIAKKENVLIGCFTNKKYAPTTISGIKSNSSISQKTITNASLNDS